LFLFFPLRNKHLAALTHRGPPAFLDTHTHTYTGVAVLKKLRVLYMSNNRVDKWSEFERLQELPALEELLFTGNPLEETHAKQGTWRTEVVRRLPGIKKLDGVPVTEQERQEAGVSA
jgi:hypothetical protein